MPMLAPSPIHRSHGFGYWCQPIACWHMHICDRSVFRKVQRTQSAVERLRSAVGRLSATARSSTVGGSTPTWGCRKYYLLSPQPDSGGCELLVILFSPTAQEVAHFMLRHEHVLLQHAQSAEYGKHPTQNGANMRTRITTTTVQWSS